MFRLATEIIHAIRSGNGSETAFSERTGTAEVRQRQMSYVGTQEVGFLRLAHRAFAAIEAIARRCAFVSFFARAAPPALPAFCLSVVVILAALSLPSSTAARFFFGSPLVGFFMPLDYSVVIGVFAM